ncbi:MAG TPA: hypothetical protein VFE53_03420 [Mucilaginibacter sp.]|jgi:hypothetical protein|nr:hypothetical protein [Mucilaginibacter sp.]
MEPIPYFFEHVNRHAVVVKPRQPLLDWINAIYPDFAEDGSETTVYLVKVQLSLQDTEKWLKRYFKDIFESELNDRHTDENDWPQRRTYKLFKEWFDIELHEHVVDMEDKPMRKY